MRLALLRIHPLRRAWANPQAQTLSGCGNEPVEPSLCIDGVCMRYAGVCQSSRGYLLVAFLYAVCVCVSSVCMCVWSVLPVVLCSRWILHPTSSSGNLAGGLPKQQVTRREGEKGGQP